MIDGWLPWQRTLSRMHRHTIRASSIGVAGALSLPSAFSALHSALWPSHASRCTGDSTVRCGAGAETERASVKVSTGTVPGDRALPCERQGFANYLVTLAAVARVLAPCATLQLVTALAAPAHIDVSSEHSTHGPASCRPLFCRMLTGTRESSGD
jgi:hypothetical protein